MITTSNSPVKGSGRPNQLLGVQRHTLAISGLSRVLAFSAAPKSSTRSDIYTLIDRVADFPEARLLARNNFRLASSLWCDSLGFFEIGLDCEFLFANCVRAVRLARLARH